MELKAHIKFYKNNRETILAYKKNCYIEKTKYINQFNNIKLKNKSKRFTNNFIRSNVDFLIKINEQLLTPIEFYEQYSIKDFSLIEIDYQHNNDFNIYIFELPQYYINNK